MKAIPKMFKKLINMASRIRKDHGTQGKSLKQVLIFRSPIVKTGLIVINCLIQ